MNKQLKISILIFVVVFCSSCDLTTKWLASEHLRYAPAKQIIPNILELRYVENDAIAFSMLKSIKLPVRSIIIYTSSILAFIVLGIITWQYRNESFIWICSLMLILSGAIGNLVDRIMNGYVVDFIHVHYGTKFSWPIFNVADIVITVGAIVLAILMLRKSSIESKQVSEVVNN